MSKQPLRIAPRPSDTRPEILVTHELSEVVEQAVAALALDPVVYQRAGELVHVVTPRTGPPPKLGGREAVRDAPVIRSMPPAVLATRLAAAGRWRRQTAKGEWKPSTVPRDAIAAVHGLGEWGGVRPIVGVISAPTMRPDGSVLQAPGYDAPTGMLHWPALRYPPVDDAPTREDAEEAAESLLDLVVDFPFAAPSDRSAWLALVLTLVARTYLAGTVPFFAVDANKRGSGKSTLVDLATLIASGADAARMPASEKDEELRKQITSQLLIGSPLVMIDNVKTGAKFGSPGFDALLTSTVWTDRDLGRMRMLFLPSRAVWCATGNNMGFVGDLERRALRIRLASDLEKPENRTDFRHGNEDALKALALKDRHILVTQALTILRAHRVAGAPLGGPGWGSFGEWATKIAGAVRWLGLPDPCLSRVSADAEEDTDGHATSATIAALTYLTAQAGRYVTAREIVDALWPVEDRMGPPARDASSTFAAARDALSPRHGGRPTAVSVAAWLRARRGSVTRGQRIASELDAATNAQRWGVA